MDIRIATPADAQALLDIYAPYVRETAITFEWEVPSVEEFARRIESTLVSYPYLVAERDGRIVGYAYTGRFGVRKSYDWCAETSIYIAQGERGNGAGRALYRAIEGISRRQRITRLMAILAAPEASNDPYLTLDSPAFHEAMGYRKVGHTRGLGYKFGRWYGDYYYEKTIANPAAAQQPFIPFSQLPSEVVDSVLNSITGGNDGRRDAQRDTSRSASVGKIL